MLLTARQLHEGQRIPRFNGVAWYDVTMRSYTCYPIPFHWLLRWGRSMWWRFEAPLAKSWWERKWERKMEDAFEAGRLEGYEGGLRDGVEKERQRWGQLLDHELDRLLKRNDANHTV